MSGLIAPPSAQSPTGLFEGTAAREAKEPYAEHRVRARVVETALAEGSVRLDNDGRFLLQNLPPNRYVLELLDPDSKVICTEGPFVLAPPDAMTLRGIDFSCIHRPAFWWLLGAATAAGLTAGAIAIGAPASPSR
jgi:hypothetical protein